jgi:hypothetical protein
MGLVELLIIILVIALLVGAFPRWEYNQDWGHGPFGVLMIIVVVILIVYLLRAI